jgi:hypothetical protein
VSKLSSHGNALLARKKPCIAFLRKRIKRGLYRSGTGKLINADVERIKADLLPNMLATANANP